MKPIVHQLSDAFRAAIQSAFGFDADPVVTPAQNLAFGDYQCNAAMGLVKRVSEATGTKANPRQIAERIKAAVELLLEDMASEITIAGPGFINVRLSPDWLAGRLAEVAADERLGLQVNGREGSAGDAAADGSVADGSASHPNPTVVVDYSGPNIAKQMHVGHLRSTIIGDCIARVLEFQGNNVVRQNHLGDWGTQFGMLIAHLRTSPAGTGESHIEDLEDFYRQAKQRFDDEPGFQDLARATVVKLQSGGAEELELWHRIVDETRRHYQPIYEQLGVALTPEHERGESFYNEFLEEVVAELTEKGVAERSEGAVVIFTEGFDSPLIVEKSGGGGYLYGTTDLAAIRHRVADVGASRIIYVHDSRQSQHFTQVFDAARRAGWAPADTVSLEFAPFGTMLGEDGRPFKTRSGATVKLRDLLAEADVRAFDLVTVKNPDMDEETRRVIARAAGIGAVKYADLSKDRTSDYVFTWDKMMSMDGNTGPYLQYALTRIRSIFRKAAEGAGAISEPEKLSAHIRLESPQELVLAKQVLQFGEVLDVVARELKPHHLAGYLYQLATAFNSFYENCPVLQSEGEIRVSRLALCDAAARTLDKGLELLGIPRLEQM